MAIHLPRQALCLHFSATCVSSTPVLWQAWYGVQRDAHPCLQSVLKNFVGR